MAQKNRILSYILERMTKLTNDPKTKTPVLRKDLKELKKVSADMDLIFQVRLHSCWADEGELSLSYTSWNPNTLENTIKAACGKFKELNRRSDVQANVAIFVVLPNGTKIKLPKKFWGEIYEKYSQPVK